MECPICGNFARYKFESQLKRKVCQCSSIKCRHLFIENFAETAGICGVEDRGYDLSVEKLRKDRHKRIKLYDLRNKLIFKTIFEKLNLSDHANVLDFGSGDGSMMYSLKSLFPKVKVTCIEPHKVFKELLIEIADNVVESVLELTEMFDLIVLNEVIEHLNFPIEELKSLARVLKNENAAIYIATPLGETHILSNDTGAYNTYSHLHFFTRKSLNLCLDKAGLTSLDVDDINYPMYSVYSGSSLKGKVKSKIKNFIIRNVLKLNIRYCMLPQMHISGLAYKK